MEVADLVEHFPLPSGRVVRVLISPPDWDPAPRQVRVAGGSVKIGSFPRDDTHLVLILEFASVADADRIAQEVGGPWMREHILALLARGPERSVGEVVASATPHSS